MTINNDDLYDLLNIIIRRLDDLEDSLTERWESGRLDELEKRLKKEIEIGKMNHAIAAKKKQKGKNNDL